MFEKWSSSSADEGLAEEISEIIEDSKGGTGMDFGVEV